MRPQLHLHLRMKITSSEKLSISENPKGDGTMSLLQEKGPRIRKDIIDKAKQYRNLAIQYRQLERELAKLREELVLYMQDKGVTEILNEAGEGIVLEDRNMPQVTSRYTTYELEDLIQVLDPAIVSECIAEVIDKDAVEAKILLNEIPEDIRELKRTKITTCVVVK